MKNSGKLIPALFLTLLFFNVSAQTELSRTKAEINACIAKLYARLSYQQNNLAPEDSLTNLFVPDGTLTAAFGSRPMLWTPSQFRAFLYNGIRQNITDRTQTETGEHTDIFGNMAQRFSTFHIKQQVNGKWEEQRGINSIQLVKQDGVWHIHSLVWDRVRDGVALPVGNSGK